MKYKIILILLLIPLLSSKCKKEGDDCHKTIYIKNDSKSTITTALEDRENLKCRLIRIADINSGETYEDPTRHCWEDKLKENNYKFLIVDPSDFDPNKSFNCDSLYQNIALRHYDLTLEDLKAMNFTITYP